MVYARNNPSLISWHLDNCSRRLQYHLNSVANVVISCSGEDDGYIGYKKELLNYKTIKKKNCDTVTNYMTIKTPPWTHAKYTIFSHLRHSTFMFDKVEVLKFISLYSGSRTIIRYTCIIINVIQESWTVVNFFILYYYFNTIAQRCT